MTLRYPPHRGPALKCSLLPAVEEAADGEEDDEDGDDVGPWMADARGGVNDIVFRDEAFAREGVVDDAVGGERARACIGDGAGHLQRVGDGEGEDGQAMRQFVV